MGILRFFVCLFLLLLSSVSYGLDDTAPLIGSISVIDNNILIPGDQIQIAYTVIEETGLRSGNSLFVFKNSEGHAYAIHDSDMDGMAETIISAEKGSGIYRLDIIWLMDTTALSNSVKYYANGNVVGDVDFSSHDIDFSAISFEVSNPHVTWDFDGNGSADALTDGLLLLRYAFGLTGSMLTADATDPSSTLTDSEIQALIETAHGSFADIDASGSTDALTDGLLLLRYLFGLTGGMLVANATDPNATRSDGAAIGAYIESYMP